MSENPLSAENASSVVARAKAILIAPKSEWPVIAQETDSTQSILIKYVLPLAAIGPLAALIGGQIFGYGALGISWRPGIGTAVSTLIASYVLSIVSLFVLSWVANFISPKFGGQDDFGKAFKLCAYAFTASWVVGIVGLVPSLSILGILGLYSLYLFYLGVQQMMGVPQDKALTYTIVTVIAGIVLNLVAGALVATFSGPSIASGIASSQSEEMTMTLPGVGTVQVSKDGQTVTIDSEEFQGEFRVPEE